MVALVIIAIGVPIFLLSIIFIFYYQTTYLPLKLYYTQELIDIDTGFHNILLNSGYKLSGQAADIFLVPSMADFYQALICLENSLDKEKFEAIEQDFNNYLIRREPKEFELQNLKLFKIFKNAATFKKLKGKNLLFG